MVVEVVEPTTKALIPVQIIILVLVGLIMVRIKTIISSGGIVTHHYLTDILLGVILVGYPVHHVVVILMLMVDVITVHVLMDASPPPLLQFPMELVLVVVRILTIGILMEQHKQITLLNTTFVLGQLM